MRMILLAVLITPALTACGPRVVTKERVETVSVPVIQKCASDKPAAVTPLRDAIPQADWDALTLKQKAELSAAQALLHLNYGAALSAATSAC